MIQAQWLDMKFEINPQAGKAALLGSIDIASKLNANSNSDSAGQTTTDMVSRELTKITTSYNLVISNGQDVKSEIELWDSHIGDYAPLLIGGEEFLFDNWQLTSVTSNSKLTPTGQISSARINLEFTEYAPEKRSEKATSSTSSTSKSSGSSSGSKLTVDKDAVSKADERVNGYKSQVNTGASAADKGGTT